MDSGRFDGCGGCEAVLAPEDQALLMNLLPALDERPGPARRRPRVTFETTAQAVLDVALAKREQMALRLTDALSAARGPLGLPARDGSRSGCHALVAGAAAVGLLLAAVVVTRVGLPPWPAPAPVQVTRAGTTPPWVDGPGGEASPAMEAPGPETVSSEVAPTARPPRHKRPRQSPRRTPPENTAP